MRSRRNWAVRINHFLLLAVVSVAARDHIVGSIMPTDCEPGKYQCPARFVCLPRRRHGGSHCVCSRFLGFWGVECQKYSRASWLLLVLSVVSLLGAFKALLSNIMLALELKESGRLKANNIGRTLFFNTLVILPAMSVNIGYLLILVLKDYLAGYLVELVDIGLQASLACLLFFYFLSTLSVSMVWIFDVHRMSSLGLGRENQMAKKRQERIWLLTTYVIALSSVALAVIFFELRQNGKSNSNTAGQIASIIGSIYNIIVAGSYHYAGKRVVRDLSVSEVNPTARLIDIAQIAENIRITSQNMTRLTLGMSVSLIGAALTVTSADPLYPTQNSLPRIFQAQIGFFMAQTCGLGVNTLIVEYLRYGSNKRHLKADPPWIVVSALRWLFLPASRATHPHLLRTAVVPSVLSAGGTGRKKRGDLEEIFGSDGNDSSSHRNVFSISDLASSSDGVSSLSSEVGKAVWSQLQFNLNGRGERNQRIVKVAVENVNGLLQPQYCSALSSDAEPFMPMMLITLLQTKDRSGGTTNGKSSATISKQGVWARGQAVIDIGEGVVVNLDSDDMATNDLEVLSKGSHAFVRCYGEEHLRCTWHAFEFGFAGGHEMLADRCMVLMEGELEVDAQGLVTRWLHRGGADASPFWGLNIPPRRVIKLIGLPFSTAWIAVTGLDVNKLEASCQASLISDGILFRIDCDTKQRASAHTSVLDITGDSQAPKVASTSQITIASLKAVMTNACAWEDSSMTSAGSDISSDRSESKELDSFGRAATVVRGVQMCVVPRSPMHAEDMWIVNVSGSGMWDQSPLQEAHFCVCGCLASLRSPKCPSKFRSRQIRPVGSHRTGSLGGSRGTRSGKWRLGDPENNERAAELDGLEISEGSYENDRHTGEGPVGILGPIAEE